MKFLCKKCGLCCPNIRKVQQIADFDDGTGVCVHLTNENKCDIYDERPIWCNVEKMYEVTFKDTISEVTWIEENTKVCNQLMPK